MDSSEEYQEEEDSYESSSEVDDLDMELDDDDNLSLSLEEDDHDNKRRRLEDGGSQNQCKVLSTLEILQLMNDYIREGNAVLELAPTTMRLLLNHFNWDKEKLFNAYWEGDRKKLFREAGVAVITGGSNGAGGGNGEGEEECGICFTENPSSMTFGMDCGHRYCNTCWTSYLTTKIMEDGLGLTISCAAHKCPIYVDDATIMTLVKDPLVQLKYHKLITNGFVQCHRLMRWCPSVDCNHAILVQDLEWRPVTCLCGHTFCFLCSHEWHAPASCALLKKWQKKCVDDSGTSKWIAVHTKPCPKCNTDIEKNGGCNHMNCTNANCMAHFCWNCIGILGAEAGVGGGCRCGLHQVTVRVDVATGSRELELAKMAKDRYFLYYDRYMNQRQSLKLETELYSSIEDKMKHLQMFDMSWVEVQFLRKAVDTLCDCRRTLVYCYAFAFFLEPDNNQSAIFDGNQRDLESATEMLSEYLERDIQSADDFVEMKMKVQDKTKYCEGRRNVLLEHVQEGYEKEWWVSNDE